MTFSNDGKILFSSAGQKEVFISPLRIGTEEIISVEFGGYSDISRIEEEFQRDDDMGGDLRIMGIDVRDQIINGQIGYLVSLVLSDSTVKVYLLNPFLI
jgi:hypothetical protein